MRKKSLAVLLTLTMLLGLFPATALADEPGTEEPPQAAETETITVDTSDADLPDNDELFAGYVQQLMYPGYGVSLFGNFGATALSESQKAVYDKLKNEITKVAQTGGSTTFLPLKGESDLSNFLTISWSSTTTESSALNAELTSQIGMIIDCLMVDCPYELYWYNKTEGAGLSYSQTAPTGNGTTASAQIGNFQFSVAQAYQDNGNSYSVDGTKASAATTAVSKAQSIVNTYSSKSTYERLAAYKEEICNLVSYNDEAAADGYQGGYGDPWQIIYVFDEKTDTNVVCEGYAKAFQYLCDLSNFTDGTVCYTVTGQSNAGKGAGDHMWNIVTLGEENYLVDVTNSDTGAIGKGGELFLAGTSGSVDGGYTFKIDSNNSITYTYDSDTTVLYGTQAGSILNLATENYTPPETQTPITGEVSITGDAKIGSILTAETSKTPENATLKYQWYRGETAIDGASSTTYTPTTAADVGQTIKVEVKADGYSGSVMSAPTAAVAKGDGPAAPEAPKATATYNTITVTVAEGQEYACVEGTGAAPTEDSSWQTSGTFTNLQPSTEYSIYARVAGTDTLNASSASPAAKITTKAAPISAVTVDVTAPVTGAALIANATVTSPASGITGTVVWYQGNSVSGDPVSGNAAASTVYTAKITLTLTGDAPSFDSSVAVTLNGESSGTVQPTGNTLVITKTFPATEAKTVQKIEVTNQPTKTKYAEGENFDPAGMVVKATYDDGTTDENFTGYTVENGDKLAKGTTSVTLKAGNVTTTVAITVKGALHASDFVYTAPGNLIYDGAAKTAGVTYANGITAEQAGAITVSYDPDNPTNVGTYTVFVRTAGGTEYAPVSEPLQVGTFTITKANQAALTISSTGPATYGQPYTLTTTGGSTNGAVTYSVTNGTGSATISGNTLTPTKAGDVTVTATMAGNDNYEPVTSTSVTITIGKAQATTDMKTAASTIVAGKSSSVTLPALPEGARYGEPSTTNTNEVTSLAVANGALTYTGGEDVVTDAEYTVTISVAESTNYNAYEITVTLTGSEKLTPTLTVNPIVVTYTGSEVPASAITGTAKVGDTVVAGTWNWGTGANPPTNVSESGSYDIFFTPTDSATYATAYGTVQVTINKATPTGTPTYTAITTSGKTLADANLQVGSITPDGGQVRWDLDPSTVVTANTTYAWTYTPTDTANYKNLTGSITLWVQSTNPGGSTGGGSSSSSGSSSSGSTTTDRNPDGSTTTTVTSPNGTVTETTRYPNGSKEVVETKKDGTVTTTTTDTSGNETKVVENPNGSTETTISNKDGSSSTTTVSRSGQVTAEVKLPASVVDNAGNQAVTLPMPEVPVTSSRAGAPTVTVDLPSGSSTKVEIPVKNVTPGTVAILVKADGTESVIKTSVTTADGVAVTLRDGDTVKIVENSKNFYDVGSSHWAADSIDFATSRELFAGTTETTFNPGGTMTRAMIWTVLARLDDADTTNTGSGAWYAPGLAWASDNGISDGSNPNGYVSRQQLVTLLYRYAWQNGYDTSARANLSTFPDNASLESYATDAMAWAVSEGIIGGMGDGTLNPNGNASRAQVAAILQRFVETSGR